IDSRIRLVGSNDSRVIVELRINERNSEERQDLFYDDGSDATSFILTISNSSGRRQAFPIDPNGGVRNPFRRLPPSLRRDEPASTSIFVSTASLSVVDMHRMWDKVQLAQQ